MAAGDTNIVFPNSSGSLPVNLFASPDCVAFDPTAYIPLPAIGATASIINFAVDDGYIVALRVMGNEFIGAGFVQGSGSLIWQLLDNGGVIRNYDNIVSSLGTVANPRPLGGGCGVLIQEGHNIVLQVTNVSLAVGGAQVGGRLGGWYIPKWRLPDEFTTF